MVLSAEDYRLFDPRLNDFQQIEGIIYCQLAYQPFIKDQQIDFLVCFDYFTEFIVISCNCKFIKKISLTYLTDLNFRQAAFQSAQAM